MPQLASQPGDRILDRRLPEATVAERQAARERLHAFARVLMDIATRIEREAEADSRDSLGRPRMAGSSPSV
jgi:hypothetical protein